MKRYYRYHPSTLAPILSILLSIFAPLTYAQHPPTPYFSNATSSTGLSGVQGFRIAIADINGDHYPDLLLHKRPNESTGDVLDKQFLFLNVPGNNPADPTSRTFVDVTAQSGIRANRRGTTQGRHSSFAVFADVDNDGDLDMFSGLHVHNPAQYTDIGDRNDLFLNDGHGHFTLASDTTFHDDGILNTSSAVFLDYDRDGNIDIFIGNWFSGVAFGHQFFSDQLYRGHGDGSFTNVTASAGLNFELPTYAVSAADVNNSGWMDLFAPVYCRAQSIHWQNNSNATFTQLQQVSEYGKFIGAGHGSDPNIRNSCSWGSMPRDFDNDADIDFLELMVHGADISVSGQRRPSSALLINQLSETGTQQFNWDFISRPEDPDTCHHRDHYGSWLDIDNDGLADFVISQTGRASCAQNPSAPHTHTLGRDDHIDLFRQSPTHTFNIVTSESGLEHINQLNLPPHNASPLDYDLDGDEDLLIGFTGNDGVQLWRNEVGHLNNWITLLLKGGQQSNKSAIGARITLEAGGTTYTREIYAGHGHFGPQVPLAATFGLGQATKVDRITVQWPNTAQTTHVVTDIPVNRRLFISEAQVISLVGDKDHFHPGDPDDTPFRSARVQSIIDTIASDPGQGAGQDLDAVGHDRPVGFTHRFTLPTDAQITDATLRLKVKGNSSLVHNDFIIYDQSVESSASVGFLPVIAFRDLIGREPADGEVHTVAFNLAKAPVRTVDTAGGPGAHWSEQPEAFRNLLGTLLDGEFNMVVVDDMIIDFSELIITSVSPTERPGDFNGDGAINNDDLDILLQARNTDAYGPNDPRDLDNNGKIDTRDARLMVLCLRTGACNF